MRAARRGGGTRVRRRDVPGASAAFAAWPVAAQYPPSPDATLAAVQGAWRGTLTYRDDARPDRNVVLATRLHAALVAPTELALHDVFDDGPGKTVHSYERMAFDFAGGTVTWTGEFPAGRRRSTASPRTKGRPRPGSAFATATRSSAARTLEARLHRRLAIITGAARARVTRPAR